MKAIQIQKTGAAEVLQIQDLLQPKPGPDEALIHLKAAGINFIDILMRSGSRATPLPVPFIPGLEGAGVVEAIGANVTEVKVGDRVAYTGKIGSYAEYNVVKAQQLILLPDAMSFEQGAALPLQGMTAHYLTHDFYPITAGSSVLIHAAAGGVGLLVVQWLKHLGANNIGTVSTEEKAKFARDAGAEHIIFYTRQDFVEEVKKLTNGVGVDYIIDGVGKSTFMKDLEAARIRGWICLFGMSSGAVDPFLPNLLQPHSLTISGGMLTNHIHTREELIRRSNAVFKGIQEGWLKFKIDHVYPLAEAAAAHQAVEDRKTSGKVILKI